jgi:hypothetical protein
MPPLTAILLRLLHGRVGSSLLMQLLSSSDEVVCDRVMPYEHRYLAYFIEATRPRNFPRNSAAVPLGSPSAGGNCCVNHDVLAQCSLAALWQAFSAVAHGPSASVPPRYYAEKSTGALDALVGAAIPFCLIDVVRDPRDIYVSARAFAERLGRDAFGLHTGAPDSANVPIFLCDIARRMDAIGSRVGTVEPLLICYEDMIIDLPEVAANLGRRLGIQLDPDRVVAQSGDNRSHMTAATPLVSVGRWRTELDDAVAAVLTRMLAEPMRRFGYSLSLD